KEPFRFANDELSPKGFNLTNYSVTDLGVVRVLKLQSAARDCLPCRQNRAAGGGKANSLAKSARWLRPRRTGIRQARLKINISIEEGTKVCEKFGLNHPLL